MRVTILGASRFGVATARQLIDDDHEVVLIDIDREKLEDLADGLDAAFVCGDGTLPSTLRDAFGDGSDALVTLTNVDDVNILSAVVGRAVGYERVIPQIVRPELMSVVHELDLDDAITPHENLARSIVAALTDHSEVETEMVLHRDLRIVGHEVTASMDGKSLEDLDLPEQVRAIALSSNDEESFIEADARLSEGDQVIFVLKSEETENLKAVFDDAD